MNDPVSAMLFQLIGERMSARGLPTMEQAATPATSEGMAVPPAVAAALTPSAPTPVAEATAPLATPSPAERSKGIMSIISETYAIPNANAEERRVWAKRRIADEYGEDVMRKYMRTREGKALSKPQATPTPAPDAAPATTPPAAAAAAPATTSAAPVISVDSEMRKLLTPAQQ